ncbi:MAG: alpha/beta fold hydrolase [Polyangiaceae bacterium]
MILHGQVVEQAVDLGLPPRHFVKQLVMTQSKAPLAMVRKRLSQRPPPVGEEQLDVDAIAAPSRAAVLLVHGYSQNRYAWHLPSRSLVNYLACASYDVFNIDLRGHGRSDHLGAGLPERVDQFVQEDLPAALDSIHRLSGFERVFLIGHSLGGLCAYAVAAERPAQVAGVVSIGSPYRFTAGTKLLAGLSEAFLLLDRTLGMPNIPVPARLYGRFVRVSQRVVNSRLYPVPLRGFRRGSMEPEVLRQHMALAMDQGSIETMRTLFTWAAESRASRSTTLFGLEQAFEELDLPLLVIAGSHDDLAPPASVRPGFERSTSTDKTYRELPFGHIDLLVGRDAPRLTWPLLERWLDRRSEALSREETSAA